MITAIRLRPLGSADLPWLFELQSDPESNRMAGTIARTPEAFDAHYAKILADATVAPRVIVAGEERVGMVSCFQKDGEDHVGYWIDKAWWGRGVASRSLELLLEEVTRRPLIATAATSNGASIRVLLKCGFVVEQVRLTPADDRHPECEVATLVLRDELTRT